MGHGEILATILDTFKEEVLDNYPNGMSENDYKIEKHLFIHRFLAPKPSIWHLVADAEVNSEVQIKLAVCCEQHPHCECFLGLPVYKGKK